MRARLANRRQGAPGHRFADCTRGGRPEHDSIPIAFACCYVDWDRVYNASCTCLEARQGDLRWLERERNATKFARFANVIASCHPRERNVCPSICGVEVQFACVG